VHSLPLLIILIFKVHLIFSNLFLDGSNEAAEATITPAGCGWIRCSETGLGAIRDYCAFSRYLWSEKIKSTVCSNSPNNSYPIVEFKITWILKHVTVMM